jgi:plastocyanin
VNRFVPLLALALTVAFPLGATAAKHAAAAAPGAMSPAGVTCAAGDPVVWVNTETKVYHMAGTSYYGKTKHGKYACASDAGKMGAHAAKRESAKSAAKGGCTMSPESMGMGTSTTPASGGSSASGKHHRHKGGSMMSPMPAPSPM